MTQNESTGRIREVRIGLVMYGGVSLAIYMNGVANELFRAVRGRGVYKLFKQLTDSDVVVDIVSGASAGGINGMFLAFALCNAREFSKCADLWRTQGDIKDLLRKPGSAAETQTSLLDSEAYYEPQLAGAFQKMWQEPSDRVGQNDAPSQVSELDLFVAGTDFNGRLWTTVDSAAHVIDVKDYRARFWLKHRAGRKAQLDPRADALGRDVAGGAPPSKPVQGEVLPEAGFAAFARLARITSCFPAAFAPVSVRVPPPLGAGEKDAKDMAVARKLGVWGALEPGEYHFLDGGILDNKPFTSTIQAIFYRMANRPVQRHLLYVEPDPERFGDQRRRVPTFFSSALDSLTRLPSYESISGDLQEIGKHNDSIERYKRTCSELRNWVMSGPAPAREGPGKPRNEARAIYEHARLQALADLAGEGLLSLEPGNRLDDRTKDRMADLRHALDAATTEAEGRARGPRAFVATLFERYDVEFRLRRLMHLTYVLMPAAQHPSRRAEEQPQREGVPSVPTPGQLLDADVSQSALIEIGHRIALLEIVRAKILRSIERSAPMWRELEPDKVWGQVLERLDVLLDQRGLPAGVIAALKGEEQCQTQLGSLASALELRTDPKYAPLAAKGDSLLLLADEGEASLMAKEPKRRGPLEHEYQRFEALDQVLFPIQFVADLHEQDIIRTVRVSPLDAQRGCSAGNFSDKVTGESLAHFGAFLKRSWRSNDILYGRLDGACQLLETLFNPSWLRTSLAQPGQRKAMLCRFGVEGPDDQHDALLRTAALERWLSASDIFPNAGADAVQRAARAVSALLEPADTPDFEARIKGAAYQELLNALVEATHFSILQEDYAKLVQDSIDEQLAWRSGKVAEAQPPEQPPAQPPEQPPAQPPEQPPAQPQPKLNPETRAFDLTLDNLAVEAAASRFASDALAGRQSSQELVRLLRKYHVGREEITDDVPPSVLLELIAHSLLILRNCIINSFSPRRAAAIRGSRSYRVFVDWPLRAFHALAVLLRERPAHGGVALGLIAYFLLAVVVNVCFLSSPWALPGWRGFVATLLFVGLPLWCLGAAAALISASEYSWKSVRSSQLRLARRLLIWMALAATVLLVLAPVYIAYAYVATAVSAALQPTLCQLTWLPAGSCSQAGYVVVLALVAALSFGVGRLTARRVAASPEAAADETRNEKGAGSGGEPPASSGRGEGDGAVMGAAAE